MRNEGTLKCVFFAIEKEFIEKLKGKIEIEEIQWFDYQSGISFFYNANINKNYFETPDNIYDHVFQKSFNTFIDQFNRHNSSTDKDQFDMLNIYNLFYNFFFELLSNNKVDIVIFGSIPHHGAEGILYYIAKELDIKTLILHMTHIPERFYFIFDIEDYGIFNETPNFSNPNYIKIEKKYEKKLDYMDFKDSDILFSLQTSTLYNGFKCGSLILKKILYLSAHLLRNMFTQSNKEMIHNLDQYTKINGYINYTLIKQSKSDYLFFKFSQILSYCNRVMNHKISRKKMKSLIKYDVDLSKKYVYFPLHMQPEMTTSSLGGIYVDQLLAIERLSNILPEGWLIYVKENPRQTDYMRGKWFYNRLKAIRKVVFVDPKLDTYLLLKNCAFASTVTGTVGWEAITGGKNVLIFGNSWYKCLPGVFSYNPQIDINRLINNKIDHKILEYEFNELMKKTGEGIITKGKEFWIKNFNYDKNAEKIASSIKNLLDNVN